MSKVPWVDNDFCLLFDSTLLMFANCSALSDVSFAIDWAYSPAVSVIIAVTSAADLSIVLMLKSLKSCNWLAVSDNKF